MCRYIGNIVVPNKTFKVDEWFNKCQNIEDVDNSIPTLIIGLKNAKENIKEFSILKKRYGDCFWTFNKNERYNDYEEDINKFTDFCIKRISDTVYRYVNVINFTRNDIKKWVDFLKSDRRKYFYNDRNRFLFILDVDKSKVVYGISLSTCNLLSIKTNSVLKLLNSNKNNILLKNFYSIPKELRKKTYTDIPTEMKLMSYFIAT